MGGNARVGAGVCPDPVGRGGRIRPNDDDGEPDSSLSSALEMCIERSSDMGNSDEDGVKEAGVEGGGVDVDVE